MTLASLTLHWTLPLAAPKQEDVLKSISDNVNSSNFDGRSLGIIILCVVALLILLVLANMRLNSSRKPKVLNHYGKLMKELKGRIPLKAAELKQLKILSQVPTENGPLANNPLVMVLCPSLMTKGLANKSVKVDRKILAGLARKMGLIKK